MSLRILHESKSLKKTIGPAPKTRIPMNYKFDKIEVDETTEHHPYFPNKINYRMIPPSRLVDEMLETLDKRNVIDRSIPRLQTLERYNKVEILYGANGEELLLMKNIFASCLKESEIFFYTYAIEGPSDLYWLKITFSKEVLPALLSVLNQLDTPQPLLAAREAQKIRASKSINHLRPAYEPAVAMKAAVKTELSGHSSRDSLFTAEKSLSATESESSHHHRHHHHRPK